LCALVWPSGSLCFGFGPCALRIATRRFPRAPGATCRGRGRTAARRAPPTPAAPSQESQTSKRGSGAPTPARRGTACERARAAGWRRSRPRPAAPRPAAAPRAARRRGLPLSRRGQPRRGRPLGLAGRGRGAGRTSCGGRAPVARVTARVVYSIRETKGEEGG
jgi:hypothetical protein